MKLAKIWFCPSCISRIFMRSHFFILTCTLSVILMASCEKGLLTLNPELRDGVSPIVVVSDGNAKNYPKEVDYPVVPENHPALECMRKKAHQIADIEWTPLKDIPGLTKPIPAGIMRTGIPYSSVKEKDKFVGQEVSFHTFMTALHNPRSVLYTEDVKEPPYYGVNCGPYYGTVCSGAVNYALGIDRPYESSMYENVPYIAKVKNQSAEGICSGDILWSPGHVVLVIDVKKDESGKPQSFTILESFGRTSIKELSLASFMKRWETVGWVAYRNMRLAENLQYTPIPYVLNEGDEEETVTYNEDLCTSRGDQVTYVEGESVVINVLTKKYPTLEVLRDGISIKKEPIVSEDVTFRDLESGLYTAHLCNNDDVSGDIYFEIINEKTSVSRFGGGYFVSFSSSNGVPVYLVVCTRSGVRHKIVDISQYDISSGGLLIQGNYSGMYLKVFYQGQYGKVSNSPIMIL